jgi:hypothetical protein
MSEPTARELIDSLSEEWPLPFTLASRVEAVLALEPRRWAGWDCCLAEVLRLLNGEER